MIHDRSPRDSASHPDTMVTFDADRAGLAVVHLRGEYDHTNVSALARQLAGAIAGCDGDVAIDLADVAFMDSSTISALDEAGAFLGLRSRSLMLRSPTTFGRHLLDVSGLGALIEVARNTQPSSA